MKDKLMDCLMGLQFLHKQGFVYRKLRPRRIWVMPFGKIKFSSKDFLTKTSDIDSNTYTGITQYEPCRKLRAGNILVDLWAWIVIVAEV
jgi:serine/threonine protein kinase